MTHVNQDTGFFQGYDGLLVNKIMGLPHRILQNHEVPGLEQMVLHELSHDNCFGLDKATYLVDNPDFDCIKGVAGFCKQECGMHKQDLWQESHAFNNDMKSAEFHNNMMSFLRHGLKRNEHVHDADDIRELGTKLGLQNPSFLAWPMRHGNHGILIFQADETKLASKKELLANVMALLSLCA
jgi:hypothetical protein